MADTASEGSKLTYQLLGDGRVDHYYAFQHPERIAAHRAVKQALITGKLKKPLFCMRCFLQRRIECHHPDYNKPLQVQWLCRPCHTYVHPKTQKNAKSKPTFLWKVKATADEMAAAMACARTESRS